MRKLYAWLVVLVLALVIVGAVRESWRVHMSARGVIERAANHTCTVHYDVPGPDGKVQGFTVTYDDPRDCPNRAR